MAEKQEKIAELKVQRASTKGCITRIKNLVEQKADSLSSTEVECRLGILESYFKQVLVYQTSIEKLLPEDATEANVRGDLEDLYCAAKSKLLSLMGGGRKTSLIYESGNKVLVASSSPGNLPKLRLPQFSGRYSEFLNFYGCFTKLVHKEESLSNLEKFNHLLACVSGAALRTIKAFEVTEANYDKALNRLKERYDNKFLIFQEHVVDLFNLPKVSKNSASQLRSLIDSANAHSSSLESLGKSEDIVNAFLIYIVNSKLDPESQSAWEEKMEFSELPAWSNCADSLIRRCQYLESREAKLQTVSSSSSVNHEKKLNRSRSSNTNMTSLATSQASCAYCSQSGHVIYKCPNFIRIPVYDRLREVKKRALCLNCLFKGHSVKSCKVRRCQVCSMPHHTLLHRYSTNPKISTPEPSNDPNQEQVRANIHSNHNEVSTLGNTSLQTSHQAAIVKNHVFLATAVVKVKDKFGKYHLARALLDSASQINFMTESLAQMLKLKRDKFETSITGIGATSSKVRHSTQAIIQSRVNNYEINLPFYILSNITGSQPERKIKVQDWKIPANIQLADPWFFEPQKVDLLLGADNFFQLLCVGQIKLGDNLPILQKTLWGWIVSGKSSEPLKSEAYNCSLVFEVEELNKASITHDEALNNIVEKFWEDECIALSKPVWNEEQHECERIFSNTFQRLPNGRFMVKLPFKKNPDEELGNSWETAKSRLRYLERRLAKNNEIKIQYSEFLREYLAAGHMERISLQDVPNYHYFMPHQCVLRPQSSTTKLRVVFDASCRTTSSKSLNELLMVGPTVQEDIVSIMLRFRCYTFALTADISAMYRQILVSPEDRNFQLIIWRENPADDVQIFRLNTVTYGTAAAPFLATRCLVQLADEFAKTMPDASRIIRKEFDMDDLITGANTSAEIHRIREEVEDILGTGQFSLRKWYSNDHKLLSEIPEADREKTLKINDLDIIKTLGIVWEPAADEFRFHYEHNTAISSKTTKMTVLSDVARLFDPLGLINPVVVKAKVFLQELWILKLHWDESIPLEFKYKWSNYRADVLQLHKLKIPRCVYLTEDRVRTEIHGFSDASTRAYGCCIYIRSTYASAAVSVILLTAKSKVAPIRTVRSLPCLELCAALLLAKLLDKTRSSLSKPYDKMYLWTDSEIVLDWLACHPSTWKTFVANRVSEIQSLTADATWRHVNSKANPADIISRGCRVNELSDSIWLCGPEFLKLPPDAWPVSKDRHSCKTTLEKREVKSILICTASSTFLEEIYSCSDFMKNCRRFAWVFRFIRNIQTRISTSKNTNVGKVQIRTGPISAEEIDDAFLMIIWIIQQKEFSKEIRALETETGSKFKDSISKLNPFLDGNSKHKLLRVGGRLKHCNIPYDCKFPILLPKSNPFIKSYVKYLHYKNFHAGSLTLVSIIRQRFWIINARDYTRQIARSCLHCFKYRPRLMQQIMADLPTGRVNFSLPFTHCGVDFCGPFQTTFNMRGKTTYKSYGALFICFATKAVHLEVVSDLTSEAFLAALKRFIGRRNLCRHLYCDNATNFVGARRQLKELRQAFFQQQYQEDINSWCSTNNINFHHIPPRAPHFGGLWEAAIKSAKKFLFTTYQGALLTFEELTTVMVQIEAVLNSRPITPLSSDPNDAGALTPAHFLNQAPIEYFLEPDFKSVKLSLLRRWQRVSALLQHFWQRWSKEYLGYLQERTKWHEKHHKVSVGTLVLVHQDDLPPYKWRLGRIVSTTAGIVGKIRVVFIQTTNGIIQRAIHKIAPIPTDED